MHMHTHSSDQYTLGTPQTRATHAPGVSRYCQPLAPRAPLSARLRAIAQARARRMCRRSAPSTTDEPAASEAAAAAAAAEPLAKTADSSISHL